MKPISTLLVANRGEIARRIFRTCRAEGIRTVAVFTQPDRGLPFVQEADLAICIGEGPASDSYLDTDKILEAAAQSNADAVHPGYGFLSENAGFAERVVAAGLKWVGPSPHAIDTMGDKTRARELAQKHQVPVVPGFSDSTDPAVLASKAPQIGFPLLIKASAGGGGRGMRRVDAMEEVPEAIASASREALSAFGNGTVFLEKFIEHPRHIEVQVIADESGTILHLGERECSIQRRHQKIIEESPAPGMTESFRAELGAAAVSVARAVQYVGAGTVEFIVDANDQFYFLEMNTRLQVEHPVTECVTGFDLVALQVAIAEGHTLPFTQEDVRFTGHAIEARIYAENPANDYAPGTGPLLRCRWPTGTGIRVDAGYETHNEISPFYDSMIAKVIAHGSTRAQATRRLLGALTRTWVVGPPTNLPLLKDILSTDRWDSGVLETGFLSLEGLPKPVPLNMERGVLAATCLGWWLRRKHAPWHQDIPAGFRVHGADWQLDEWQSFDQTAQARWRQVGERLEIALSVGEGDTTTHTVRHLCADGDRLILELDGLQVQWDTLWDRCERRPSATLEDGDRVFVHLGDAESLVALVPRMPLPQSGADEPGMLTAATPGTVVQLLVSVGDRVTSGQPLLILEAMKMEQRIYAPSDGVVESIPVAVGETVSAGDRLLRLDCEESDT